MALNTKKYTAILIGCQAVAGCGLLGGREMEAAPLGDGKGDFGEAFPIELCLGKARVVPVADAEDSAGLCVREQANTKTCAADAECAGIERCVCGRCIVQACQGAASCEGSLVCRGKRCTVACAADGECASGERCISGGCARACTSDAQCFSGERCDSLDHACAVKLCGGALSCAPGDVCESVRVGGELREPHLIQWDGQSIAFVEIRTAGAPQAGAVYRARVDEKHRWTAEPETPVLSPLDGELRVGAPSLRIDAGGRLVAYAEADSGARIFRAISTDGGLHFERDPAFVFEPGMPWESGRVASPAAFSFGGAEYLMYEGGLGAGIGLARVKDNSAERMSNSAVITSLDFEDAFFWRGIEAVGAPYTMVVDGAAYVYASVRGAEGADSKAEGEYKPAQRNDSIGLVTTRDLLTFKAFAAGPVFSRTVNLRTYLGEREACVELSAHSAAMVFVAADASGANTTGLARTETR